MTLRLLAQLAAALVPLAVLGVLYAVARRSSPRRAQGIEAYMYLYPALLILAVFHVAPVFYSLGLSFYDTPTIYRTEFTGLSNYRELLHDTQFWASLKHTLWFALVTVPATMALALALALLLDTGIRGRGFYRTVYFLPVVTSIAAVSLVWKWVYNSEYGLLNHWLGWERFDWLQQNDGVIDLVARRLGFALPAWIPEGPSIALLAVVVMSIWKGLGYNVVIFLAGLQNVPRELYEVARLDGAGPWRSFRHVTWPLLAPTTYFVLVMTTIQSFQVFAQVFMLYDGAPSDSTTVAVFYLFDTAFKSNRFGYASAMAYVLFAIILALTLIQRNVAESRIHYQ